MGERDFTWKRGTYTGEKEAHLYTERGLTRKRGDLYMGEGTYTGEKVANLYRKGTYT